MLKASVTEQYISDHVEDLRERMRLLQGDRKANVDMLEANKVTNSEEIRRLKAENKESRAKLAQLQKTARTDDENQDLRHMQREVGRMRQQHDTLRSRGQTMRRILNSLADKVQELELESKRPHLEDNPYTRRIRLLENKLDKAMIKYNEAQSIRKTYEQIVKRLREERVGFDHQVKAVTHAFEAKQRDYEELLLLSGDAGHARDVAHSELDRVRAGYEVERMRRDKELRERHQVVQLRRHMLERIRARERMRDELTRKAGGDLDLDLVGEERLQQAVSQAAVAQAKLQADKMENRSKIDVFEHAFRKIKEATGVSDVNEVIQKIVSQESTTESLVSLTRETQQKIQALNEAKKQLKERIEDIKYNGPSGGHRRKMVDEHEEQLVTSTMRLERSRVKYERLSRTFTAVKAGVEHLQDKLSTVVEEVVGRNTKLSDETISDVLHEAEVVLTAVYKRIKAAKGEQRRRAKAGDPRAVEYKAHDAHDENTSNIFESRPFNQRIDLQFEERAEHGFGSLNDPGGHEDDEITRDAVKRQSSEIIMSAEKRKRKPKKKTEVIMDTSKTIKSS